MAPKIPAGRQARVRLRSSLSLGTSDGQATQNRVPKGIEGSIPSPGTIAMKTLLIIRHARHEGPGILAEVLKTHGIGANVIDHNNIGALLNLTPYNGLLVMGGPQSANDATTEMNEELSIVRDALAMGLPYFGVCLGLQVGVKAAGGSVRKNEVPEAGPFDQNGDPYTAELTPEGKRDPLLVGVDDPLPMFHAHGETVDITPQMTLLATGKWCKHQIVKIAPRAYGMQGHLELHEELLGLWKTHTPEIAALDQVRLDQAWERYALHYRRNCERIFTNFLRIAQFL